MKEIVIEETSKMCQVAKSDNKTNTDTALTLLRTPIENIEKIVKQNKNFKKITEEQ